MTQAVRELEQAIQQAASQYFRFVILVGAPGAGKTRASQAVAQKLGCELVNVNLELSKRMLELARSQRVRQVQRLLKAVIAAQPFKLTHRDKQFEAAVSNHGCGSTGA